MNFSAVLLLSLFVSVDLNPNGELFSFTLYQIECGRTAVRSFSFKRQSIIINNSWINSLLTYIFYILSVSGVHEPRSRRSVVSGAISSCYVNFFINSKPPTGFRRNASNIRYICQSPPKQLVHVYATLFDLDYGIPIYSAYYVTKEQASQFGAACKQDWWMVPE